MSEHDCLKSGLISSDSCFVSHQQVRIMCPNLTCRRVLAVPENLRGKTVRCKNCSTNIKVPTKTGAGVAEKPDASKKAA